MINMLASTLALCAALALPSVDSFCFQAGAIAPGITARRVDGCRIFPVLRPVRGSDAALVVKMTTIARREGGEEEAGVVFNEKGEMQIQTLSFDLDGTLWPTEEVVWAANDRMSQFLNREYPGTPDAKEVQSVMKSIRQQRRAKAEAEGTQPAPVSYTELRLSALKRVTLEAGFSASEAEKASQEAFETWLEERNAAAGRMLFEGVQDMLSDIRRCFPHVHTYPDQRTRPTVLTVSPAHQAISVLEDMCHHQWSRRCQSGTRYLKVPVLLSGAGRLHSLTWPRLASHPHRYHSSQTTLIFRFRGRTSKSFRIASRLKKSTSRPY